MSLLLLLLLLLLMIIFIICSCAFRNTPKFQSVKGKGKIVTEKWVEDCYKKKIRFPWRRYVIIIITEVIVAVFRI